MNLNEKEICFFSSPYNFKMTMLLINRKEYTFQLVKLSVVLCLVSKLHFSIFNGNCEVLVSLFQLFSSYENEELSIKKYLII